VQQPDWLLRANAWGTSFMAGERSSFPKRTAGQLGDLGGSLDGSAPLEVGAVVNGPNGSGRFDGGLGDHPDGMRTCPASGDPYSAFTGHGSRYADDVRSWQSSEPALDMDAWGLLALTLSSQCSGREGPGTSRGVPWSRRRSAGRWAPARTPRRPP
jgi:endoglucanase